MTKGIHGELFERKMEGLADCVLELEVIQKGSTFERFLSVKKMRNYLRMYQSLLFRSKRILCLNRKQIPCF